MWGSLTINQQQFILGAIIVILVLYIVANGGIEYLTSGPKTLTYYTNPNCGYCKRFDPTWDKLVASKNGMGSLINFKKINCKSAEGAPACTAAKQLYSMRGTPHIVLFQNGKHTVYNGNRDFNDLTSFIN